MQWILQDIPLGRNIQTMNILVREYLCSGGTETANPAVGNR